MAARLWPDLDDKHRWALELMEERLAQTTQRPEALVERAKGTSRPSGSDRHRRLSGWPLALADRYELAAARRKSA